MYFKRVLPFNRQDVVHDALGLTGTVIGLILFLFDQQ